ncbi:LysR family transcriptional regulator [Brenneria rubrifaciens]|uniref:LysR family transcriptional regulator n=1 Tax=Brenneria rubrifaciens TaxID=55213 RepID=UPI003CCC7E43
MSVAEEPHFARAAEKRHIEQSPLSHAIRELEEELGVVLFARTTRLTRAGKLFFDHLPRMSFLPCRTCDVAECDQCAPISTFSTRKSRKARTRSGR